MESVSLTGFEAKQHGDDVPEPESDPTWDELVALDTRFADLLNLARSHHKSRRWRFCATHVYIWELKPQAGGPGWLYPPLGSDAAAHRGGVRRGAGEHGVGCRTAPTVPRLAELAG